MFLDSVGIILNKNNKSQYKITILDKIQGKIECIAPSLSMSIGALITYTIKHERSFYFIDETKLIYIPFSLAQTDILFFHHVLELIYYFTYMNSCNKKVFDLLQFLYGIEHETMTRSFKKIFLLKLLLGIDNIPEWNEKHSNLIVRLNTIELSAIVTTQITNDDEKELDTWLWYCVYQHPYVNTFKTTHFLAKNRIFL